MEQSIWLFQKSPISERFFKSVLNNVNLTTGVKCHCNFCIVSTFSRNNEYLLSFLIQQTLRNTVFLLFWLFLQELSSYRCPLTGGVFLQEVLLEEVSSYRRCLPTGGVLLQEVLLQEVSSYLTGGVHLLELSSKWRSPPIEGVHPQEGYSFKEMSSYLRCPPTGGVLQMEESMYRRCPPTGGVFFWDVFLLKVSAYTRCLPTGGVHSEIWDLISSTFLGNVWSVIRIVNCTRRKSCSIMDGGQCSHIHVCLP